MNCWCSVQNKLHQYILRAQKDTWPKLPFTRSKKRTEKKTKTTEKTDLDLSIGLEKSIQAKTTATTDKKNERNHKSLNVSSSTQSAFSPFHPCKSHSHFCYRHTSKQIDQITWTKYDGREIRTMYQENQSKHMQVTIEKEKRKEKRKSEKRKGEKRKEKQVTQWHIFLFGVNKSVKSESSKEIQKGRREPVTPCIRWCGSEQKEASEWTKKRKKQDQKNKHTFEL